MNITVEHEVARVPVTIFHLDGDLTAEDPLRSRGREAYEEGTRHLLLDMSEVPYVSSSGLRALQALYNLLGQQVEGDGVAQARIRKEIAAGTYASPYLKLLNPSKNVRSVLRISGYDMLLEIHDDYEEAIASF